jgi:hypothetical protein
MVCTLLGDDVGVLVQLVLGGTALGFLMLKRRLERPKRKLRDFCRDVSKQVIGSLMAHGMNLLIAVKLSQQSTCDGDGDANGDECMWYFMNFLVDVGCGVVLNWAFLNLLSWTARRYDWTSLHSGEYLENGGSICRSWPRWLRCGSRRGNATCPECSNRSYVLQLMSWIGIVSLTKLILYGCILIPFHTELGKVGTAILKPVSHNDTLELMIVMVVVPVSLNILQFWIQDNFLQAPAGGVVSFDDIHTTSSEDSDVVGGEGEHSEYQQL